MVGKENEDRDERGTYHKVQLRGRGEWPTLEQRFFHCDPSQHEPRRLGVVVGWRVGPMSFDRKKIQSSKVSKKIEK